jgi:hypothetical protein
MSSKSSQYHIKQIPLSQIEPWEEVNVRRRQVKADINELVESIRHVGLLEPIIVQEGSVNLTSIPNQKGSKLFPVHSYMQVQYK